MPVITSQHTVVIRKPPAEVFRYLADEYFVHRRERSPLVIEVEQTSPGPVGVGTTGRELSRDNWGIYTETLIRVTEFSPPRAFAIESTSRYAAQQPEAKIEIKSPNAETHQLGRIELSPHSAGTKVHFYNETEYDTQPMTFKQEAWFPLWKMQRNEQYRLAVHKVKAAIERKQRTPLLGRLAILGPFWLYLWGAIAAIFVLLFWLYVSRSSLELDRETVSSLQIWLVLLCAAFMVTVTLRMMVRPRKQ
jgi:hypothetical protein